MRKRFDKSVAIDAASNLRLVTMIQNHDEPYTEAEEKMLRTGMPHFATFEAIGAKAKKAKSPTPTVKNQIAFEDGDPLGWGRSETLVRARKEEILAYLWDTAARCRWSASDMERTALETKNDHHCIVSLCKRGSHGKGIKLKPRGVLQECVWRKTGGNTLVFVGNPTEHPERPMTADKVRARHVI
jgi:hypothetical protein